MYILPEKADRREKMSKDPEKITQEQSVEKEGGKTALKVFWWVLTIMLLTLLTSGIAYLVSKIR